VRFVYVSWSLVDRKQAHRLRKPKILFETERYTVLSLGNDICSSDSVLFLTRVLLEKDILISTAGHNIPCRLWNPRIHCRVIIYL
jgi:hypothetical protein